MRASFRHVSLAVLLLAAPGCRAVTHAPEAESVGNASQAESAPSSTAASPASTTLSASGTEACDALTADSLTKPLVVLGHAKASALAAAQTHPGQGVDGAGDAIEAASVGLRQMATWLASNKVDGTNPSGSQNVQQAAATALGPLVDAARPLASLAAKTGDGDARSAFDALLHAAAILNDLAAQGGRCALDKDASWWDWNAGKAPETAAATPPAVPSSCDAFGADALAPLDALFASALASEQAAIAAHPGDFDEYGQADADTATRARAAIAALRDAIAKSGLTASDPATAAALADGLLALAPQAAYGGREATVMSAYASLSVDARRALESDATAGDYALQLGGVAARCAAGLATPPRTPCGSIDKTSFDGVLAAIASAESAAAGNAPALAALAETKKPLADAIASLGSSQLAADNVSIAGSVQQVAMGLLDPLQRAAAAAATSNTDDGRAAMRFALHAASLAASIADDAGACAIAPYLHAPDTSRPALPPSPALCSDVSVRAIDDVAKLVAHARADAQADFDAHAGDDASEYAKLAAQGLDDAAKKLDAIRAAGGDASNAATATAMQAGFAGVAGQALYASHWAFISGGSWFDDAAGRSSYDYATRAAEAAIALESRAAECAVAPAATRAGTPDLALSCSDTLCSPTATVQVRYANMPGDDTTMIGIATQAAPSTYVQYQAAPGRSGIVSFVGLPSGVPLVARALRVGDVPLGESPPLRLYTADNLNDLGFPGSLTPPFVTDGTHLRGVGLELFVETPYDFDSGKFDLNDLETMNTDPVFQKNFAIDYPAVEKKVNDELAAFFKDPFTGSRQCGTLCPDVDWKVDVRAHVDTPLPGQPVITAFGDPEDNGVAVAIDAQVHVRVDMHAHIHIGSPLVADPDFDVPFEVWLGIHGRAKAHLYPVLQMDKPDVKITWDKSNMAILGGDGTAIEAGAEVGTAVGLSPLGPFVGGPLGGAIFGAIGGEEGLDIAKAKVAAIAQEKAAQAVKSLGDQISTAANNALQPKIAVANDLVSSFTNYQVPGLNRSFSQLQDDVGLTMDVQSSSMNNTLMFAVTPRFANHPADGTIGGKILLPKTECTYLTVDGGPSVGSWRFPIGVQTANADMAGKACASLHAGDLDHEAWYGADPSRVLHTSAAALETWGPLGDVSFIGTATSEGNAYACPYTISGLPHAAIVDVHPKDGTDLKNRLADEGYMQGGRFMYASASGVSFGVDHEGTPKDMYALDMGGPGPTSADQCPVITLRAGVGFPQDMAQHWKDAINPEICPACQVTNDPADSRVQILTNPSVLQQAVHSQVSTGNTGITGPGTTIFNPGTTVVTNPGTTVVVAPGGRVGAP